MSLTSDELNYLVYRYLLESGEFLPGSTSKPFPARGATVPLWHACCHIFARGSPPKRLPLAPPLPHRPQNRPYVLSLRLCGRMRKRGVQEDGLALCWAHESGFPSLHFFSPPLPPPRPPRPRRGHRIARVGPTRAHAVAQAGHGGSCGMGPET